MNFFKLFIGDYQRDTGSLSIAEHGAYFLMLQYHYATEKPLPQGKDLYRLLRCESKADRDAVDSVAKQYWKATPEGLVNDRATEEIGKAGEQADTNRRIAQAREDKRREQRKVDEAFHEALHEACSDREPSHSHSHSQTKTKAESARKRGSRLTLTEIPDDWRAFCKQTRPELSPDAVFAKFRDYWIASPKGTKLDWDATWRNWVREERGAGKPQSSTSKTASALLSLEGMKNGPLVQHRDGERPAKALGSLPAGNAALGHDSADPFGLVRHDLAADELG